MIALYLNLLQSNLLKKYCSCHCYSSHYYRVYVAGLSLATEKEPTTLNLKLLEYFLWVHSTYLLSESVKSLYSIEYWFPPLTVYATTLNRNYHRIVSDGEWIRFRRTRIHCATSQSPILKTTTWSCTPCNVISSVQLTLRRCPDTGIEKAATVTEKGKTP